MKSLRRAEIDDARIFSSLINANGGGSYVKSSFGQYNFSSLIEFSYLSLIHADENACSSFCSFNDGGIFGGELESFEEAIDEIKQLIPAVKVFNTLLLNFWLIDNGVKDDTEMGKDMLRKVFEYCPDIDYLIWLPNKSIRLTDFMREFFVELDLNERPEISPVDCLKGMRAFVMYRSTFFPKLFVRDARVEDNDDLIPILEANSPKLVESQDEFFLADLISNQDSRNKFFVGVNKNSPVGMLATSVDVNIDLITKIYHMECYTDLLRQRSDIVTHPSLVVYGLCYEYDATARSFLAEVASESKMAYLDADLLPLVAEYYDEANAEAETPIQLHDVVDCINQAVSELLLTTYSTGGKETPVVHGCVVAGFPRFESEGKVFYELAAPLKADIFLEVIPITEADAEKTPQMEVFDTMLESMRYAKDCIEENSHFSDAAIDWIKVSQGSPDLTSFDKVYDDRLQILTAKNNLDKLERKNVVVNAFAITVFCMEKSFDSRASDLLRMAFEEHPQLDYCLFMVPNNSNPSNVTAQMSIMKLRPGISFDHSLYVIHRETFLVPEYMTVNRMITSYNSGVSIFLEPLGDEGAQTQNAVNSALLENDVDLKDNPSEACFVALLDNDVIGIITLSRRLSSTEDINWLRANYLIDDHVSYDRHRGRAQACITEWIMSPIHSHWSRFMLREVLRNYGKSLLYYQCHTDVCPPMEILRDLIPVRPRFRMQPQPEHGKHKQAAANPDVEPEPVVYTPQPLVKRPAEGAPGTYCPLYFMTKKLLSEEKTVVSTRVVVVGGHTSILAFLETICFVPYLYLSNIFLVMEVLPTVFQPANADKYHTDGSNDVGKHSGCLSPVDADDPVEQYLAALGLEHRVTVIRGRLTDIDRTNKAIIISDEIVVEYDVLLLGSGTQDNSIKIFKETSSLHPVTAAEKGIFGLGGIQEDNAAVSWMKKHADDSADDSSLGGELNNYSPGVIVYGAGLDAWAAIGKLISMKIVPPSRIHWVIPNVELPDLGDNLIDEVAIAALENCDIKVWRGFEVAHIHITEDRQFNKISGVELLKMPEEDEPVKSEDANEFVKIPCFVMLCSAKKECNIDVFIAINESGLVFDGGVVVDPSFRTVDPYIYAVGDITRFSRYYKDAPSHVNYSSRELGTYVAIRILEKHLDIKSSLVSFDNTLNRNSMTSIINTAASTTNQLPKFTQPNSIFTEMPGNLCYFRSKLASFIIEDTTPMISKEPTTGSIFLLRIDHFGTVVEVVYIGMELVEARNLSKLVGWHEAYLNSAAFMFNNGMIRDWVHFFREGWASMIYHDKFAELAERLRTNLATDKGTITTIDQVFEIAENTGDDQLVSGRRKEFIGDRCELLPESTMQTVHSHALEFMRRQRNMLVRFHIPTPAAKPTKD